MRADRANDVEGAFGFPVAERQGYFVSWHDRMNDVLEEFFFRVAFAEDFPADVGEAEVLEPRGVNLFDGVSLSITLAHRRTKGSGTRQAALTMLLKLAQSAAQHGRTFIGASLLIEVAQDTKFQDGQILTPSRRLIHNLIHNF